MNEMSILALAKICGEAGRDHATVEMIRKCLDNDVPNEYLKLLLADSDTEELKAYRDTGLTPEKIREFDEEYQRKCMEMAQLKERCDILRKTLEEYTKEKMQTKTNDVIVSPCDIRPIAEKTVNTEDACIKKESDAENTAEADDTIVEEKSEIFTGTIAIAKEADVVKPSNVHIVKEADDAVTENAEKTTGEDNSADVEAVEKTNKTNKNKGGRIPTIDIGKVMALKNAGWKIKDIAYDMHLTPEAVSNAIWRYTKKEIKKTEAK